MTNLPVKKLTACLFLFASVGHTQVLQGALTELLQSSSRITSARSDEQAAGDRAKEAFRRAWTPQFDFSLESGQQRYATTSAPDARFESVNRATASVTQLIYDFGRSNSQVAESEALARQSTATGIATSEALLLDGITAHWSVVRSRQVLDYASQSEASVRKQTRLENSMVELGKGYESNVLQAKVQLATAEARRIRAEGALQIAQARVGAVFGPLLAKVKYDEVAVPVPTLLPATLEEAHAIALANNKQIQIGAIRSEALRLRADGVRAREFLPRLQVVGEAGRREGMDGLPGYVNDRKVMLQLQYNINGGLAGGSAVDAAVKDLVASKAREDDARDLVQEQVTIAWRNLLVARSNRDILINQVAIASKFLEMASAERQLGRRSLLDILTAEMSLINAQSDLATTESDLAIAGLTLMQAMGRLNMSSVTFAKVAVKS